VGGALGLAVLATLSSSRSQELLAGGASQASALTGGYHLAFDVASGLVLLGIAVAAMVLRRELPESVQLVAFEADEDTYAA
jgi:hypothetical protein